MREKRNNPVPESGQAFVVTLTAEQIQRSHARVEFGREVLCSPPDEDSEEMRALRQMPASELEAEARQVQSEVYDHWYTYMACGQVDSYSTQLRREYWLKLLKHVMGDEWFDRAVAPIHAKGTSACAYRPTLGC